MSVLWDSPAPKAKKEASILKQLSIYYGATTNSYSLGYICKGIIGEDLRGRAGGHSS